MVLKPQVVHMYNKLKVSKPQVKLKVYSYPCEPHLYPPKYDKAIVWVYLWTHYPLFTMQNVTVLYHKVWNHSQTGVKFHISYRQTVWCYNQHNHLEPNGINSYSWKNVSWYVVQPNIWVCLQLVNRHTNTHKLLYKPLFSRSYFRVFGLLR